MGCYIANVLTFLLLQMEGQSLEVSPYPKLAVHWDELKLTYNIDARSRILHPPLICHYPPPC